MRKSDTGLGMHSSVPGWSWSNRRSFLATGTTVTAVVAPLPLHFPAQNHALVTDPSLPKHPYIVGCTTAGGISLPRSRAITSTSAAVRERVAQRLV